MKFTLSWLKEYIDVDIEPQVLADHLTMLGLEVDSVDRLNKHLAPIALALIEDVQPHPDADRLTVCTARVNNETLQVVCGAPNARAGMITAIALPGTTLPSGMKIKKSKVRGVESAGMFCSEMELGIGNDQSGIIDLPADLDINTTFIKAMDLDDTLIEVDLTPNRPDCASVIGIAREVAGFSGAKLHIPVRQELPVLTNSNVPFTVTVEDAACPRYAARLLKNVTIAPSPWWLRKRLVAVGLRPVNNVVDITNLVMLEMGQPLHAFDFAKLKDNAIVVRTAAKGETIETLDGGKRSLDEDMLLICDSETPVAVAGVMGGANSEVSDTTTDILLESAYFDPISIRRTARKLKMSTDASYRFERGIDPEGTLKALERAVELLVDIAGAEVVPDGYDVCDNLPRPACIDLRVSRTNALLGLDLTAAQISKYLQDIELSVSQKDDNTLTVCPPSFRVDLEREVDLIEEVARLEGYNDIPTSHPTVPLAFSEQQHGREFNDRVATIMCALGFYETITYSFISEKLIDMFTPGRKSVKLMNPLSEDQAVMRTSLMPGLLDSARRNLNQQNIDFRLFETGKVFWADEDETVQPTESIHLCAVMCGRRNPGAEELYFGTDSADFFDMKGSMEQLLRELRLDSMVSSMEPDQTNPLCSAFDAALSVALGADGTIIGGYGRIQKNILTANDIKHDLLGLYIDLDALLALQPRPKRFSSLPKFPAVRRDVALLVPDATLAGDIIEAVRSIKEPLMENVAIFDIYQGKSIEAGYKSVAFSVLYRSPTKTLKDKQVDKVHSRIVNRIMDRFNAKLRTTE